MKSHCKMSITKDQSLKVSCSSREVALNIHYIFLVKNVQEVPTFCHGSCVSFNHLLGTCRGDEFACANQQKCIHAFERCDGATDCSDGSDEQCSKYYGWFYFCTSSYSLYGLSVKMLFSKSNIKLEGLLSFQKYRKKKLYFPRTPHLQEYLQGSEIKLWRKSHAEVFLQNWTGYWLNAFTLGHL